MDPNLYPFLVVQRELLEEEAERRRLIREREGHAARRTSRARRRAAPTLVIREPAAHSRADSPALPSPRMELSTVSVTAAAVGLWAAVFAALHWYWALGGRAGLGDAAVEADRALATSWFAGYNVVVATASTLLCALVIPAVQGHVVACHTRGLARLALFGAVVLLGRGAVGLVALIPALLDGTAWQQPWLLLVVEPYFVVGGIVFALLRRAAVHSVTATRRRAAPPRLPRDALTTDDHVHN
jgi:hypothetical protein